tara:strand:- start:156 stop:569 length:414 start_codon:yes stop_codon:yes gene_type:complete
MNALTFFLLISYCFAQIKDPETGELATLKFDEKSKSYYLFGIDKMTLVNKSSFQGKFIAASDSLVFFKSELNGGEIIEQDIISIENLVLETGVKVVRNNVMNVNYITIEKENAIKKHSKIKKLLAKINIFKHIKFIY